MGIAILFAVSASLFIGLGEFIASSAVRTQRSETVTTTFFAVGVAVTVVAAPIVGGVWDTSDMAIGVLSGVFNGVALVLLYRAYARTPIGVAAPIVGTVFALLPVIYGLTIRNEELNTWVGLGIALGLAGVALSSFDPAPTKELKSGVLQAAVAGLIYGVTLILLGEISQDAGLWPLIPQRVVALGVSLVAAAATGANLFPVRGQRRGPIVVGVLGSSGAVAFLLAAQRGDIGVVSVAGSQFAAVAVALGWLVRREALRWWQTIGLVCAVLAVTFIAMQ